MVELQFLKELPKEVPSKLAVYRTERPSASRNDVLNVARRLKFVQKTDRPELMSFGNWMSLKHGSYKVAINRRSGALRFRDEARHGRELDRSFSVSEPRLVEIARRFVDETKLLESQVHPLKVGKITYLRTQAASLNGEVMAEQILDAGVVLTREIDNVPVTGPGGYVMINIAWDESVVAGVKIWRDIARKVGTAEILQPEYVVGQFQKRLTARGLEGLVNVLRADFGYFEVGAEETQRYLEPTYAFLFEARRGNFAYKSVELIPAIQQPKQRWRHGKRLAALEVQHRK